MSQHTRKVRYTSDYLIPEVKFPQGRGFHQITVTWDRVNPETGGSLLMDPNACVLDEFGEPTVCTKIASADLDVRMTLFKQKPGHQAYTVESRPQSGMGNYTALPVRLVTIAALGREPARVHLLVLKPDQSIERIIELHQERRA